MCRVGQGRARVDFVRLVLMPVRCNYFVFVLIIFILILHFPTFVEFCSKMSQLKIKVNKHLCFLSTQFCRTNIYIHFTYFTRTRTQQISISKL